MSEDEDRDAHPDRLKLIRMVKEPSLCTACEARLEKRHFEVGGRHLCWVCAKEIAYGIVPHGLPLQSFGGRTGLLEDEDANGARSDAMRAIEEDR